jgi:hypothetical protein
MPKRKLRRTKDVCLQVIVCKSDGSAFTGSVDIEYRHPTLNDRQVFRQLDASKPIHIGDLREKVSHNPFDKYSTAESYCAGFSMCHTKVEAEHGDFNSL